MGRVRFHAIQINPRWLLAAVLAAVALAAAVFALQSGDGGDPAPSISPPALSERLSRWLHGALHPYEGSGLPGLVALGRAPGSRAHPAARHGTPEPGGNGDPGQPPQVGLAPPDFQLADLTGRLHTLQEHAGKPVVLYFWASFCPYCQAGLPAVEKLYRDYGPERLTVLGINVQESAATAAAAARELGITFPVLLDNAGDTARRYYVRALPALFFIGSDGILQSMLVGVPGTGAVAAQIRRLLASPTTGPTLVVPAARPLNIPESNRLDS